MRIGITGATGLVGYPVAARLIDRGHDVTVFGRTPLPGAAHVPWRLGDPGPDLSGLDHLIHSALSHDRDRYRGGEGDDPAGFTALNLDGSLALWQAARAAGVHVVFLSSRAVYDGHPPGTALHEDLPLAPDSLYGRVKLAAERALGDGGVSLRATGVFGPPVPGRRHKWADLLEAHARGAVVPPGIGTEVHSDDVARAVDLVVDRRIVGEALNLSGIVLDRRDLLRTVERLTGRIGPLPPASDPGTVSEMRTDRLRALGWVPSGPEAVEATLRLLI